MRADLDRSSKGEDQTPGVRNLPHFPEIYIERRLSPGRNMGIGQEDLLETMEWDRGLEIHTPIKAASHGEEVQHVIETQRPSDHATPSGNLYRHCV